MDLNGAFRIDGQAAVVTGAASGIGEATCSVLAQAGANVVAGDIDREGADRTVATIAKDGGHAVAVHVDISSKRSVDDLVDAAADQFGQLDVMCNIAGIGNDTMVADVTDRGRPSSTASSASTSRACSSAVRPPCATWSRAVRATSSTCRHRESTRRTRDWRFTA